MNEFQETILELRRIIQDKEYTIQNLEKVKPLFDKDGTLIKYIDVLIFL